MKIVKRRDKFVNYPSDPSTLASAIDSKIEWRDAEDRMVIKQLTDIVGILAERLLSHNLLTEDDVKAMLPFNYSIDNEIE